MMPSGCDSGLVSDRRNGSGRFSMTVLDRLPNTSDIIRRADARRLGECRKPYHVTRLLRIGRRSTRFAPQKLS